MRTLLFKLLTSVPERILPYYFFIYWNRFILWLAGAKVGANARIFYKFFFTYKGHDFDLQIGNNFTMTSGNGYNPLAKGAKSHIHLDPGAKLRIGNNSGVSSVTIWCAEEISIGDNVMIGALSTVIDTDAHPIDPSQRIIDKDAGKTKPICICNNVFIGSQCIILKGSFIGENSVIGAGSVVKGYIPENEIWAGNPAVFVKKII